MELLMVIISAIVTFYSGAITEKETLGKVTKSIEYGEPQQKCREYYPENNEL
jgi:hypothetical protein